MTDIEVAIIAGVAFIAGYVIGTAIEIIRNHD